MCDCLTCPMVSKCVNVTPVCKTDCTSLHRIFGAAREIFVLLTNDEHLLGHRRRHHSTPHSHPSGCPCTWHPPPYSSTASTTLPPLPAFWCPLLAAFRRDHPRVASAHLLGPLTWPPVLLTRTACWLGCQRAVASYRLCPSPTSGISRRGRCSRRCCHCSCRTRSHCSCHCW